ncbi:MAG: hypothetical protein Q7S09_00155 [bacterium]|nr:hypothetical protein [bacterium]
MLGKVLKKFGFAKLALGVLIAGFLAGILWNALVSDQTKYYCWTRLPQSLQTVFDPDIRYSDHFVEVPLRDGTTAEFSIEAKFHVSRGNKFFDHEPAVVELRRLALEFACWKVMLAHMPDSQTVEKSQKELEEEMQYIFAGKIRSAVDQVDAVKFEVLDISIRRIVVRLAENESIGGDATDLTASRLPGSGKARNKSQRCFS